MKLKKRSKYIIKLSGKAASSEPLSAVCSCGWSYGPDDSLMTLGIKAKEHAMITGHKMRGT